MNTGINDAFDLSWKLHAALAGWGGEWLLQSYEHERRPVAIRNTQRAAANSDKNDMVMAEVTPELIGATPRGELLRADLAQKLSWVAAQYESAGVHLGYRYQKSNICCWEAGVEPPDDYRYVVNSTYPGFRAPHVWMRDGRSTLDLFGRDFVLMCFDGKEKACTDFIDAFRQRGVPLVVQPVDDDAVRRAYEVELVLVRPDGHVAWRGSAPPDDPIGVVERVRGAQRPRFVPEWAQPDDLASIALRT